MNLVVCVRARESGGARRRRPKERWESSAGRPRRRAGGALACSVGRSVLTGCSTSGTNGGSPSCAGRRAADGWPVSLGLFDRPSAPAMLAPTSKKGGSLPRPVRANSAPLCVREGLDAGQHQLLSLPHESCGRLCCVSAQGGISTTSCDGRTEDTPFWCLLYHVFGASTKQTRFSRPSVRAPSADDMQHVL